MNATGKMPASIPVFLRIRLVKTGDHGRKVSGGFRRTALLACLPVIGCLYAGNVQGVDPSPFDDKAVLGMALYFDANLSKNRTQSCATCHNPEFAFTDQRETAAGKAVSLGDDGRSLGDRNTPTGMYARFTPRFHQRKDGEFIGGQFLDGREPDLHGQAGLPFLNPIEMAMPDSSSVVARIKENAAYVAAFEKLYGQGILADVDAAYEALRESIAEFQMTKEFSPFDSRYDRMLRGEVEFTDQEELGRLLFFSQQFTNCNLCHQLQASQVATDETFSNYTYHNIGIPVNPAARAVNGTAPDHRDRGLLDNPAVSDSAQEGKFKVPTLRNVAVTGPYMHNGVFEDLRTTVVFYNKYNSRAPAAQTNPETGEPWRLPEVDVNLSLEELEHGPALDQRRVDALVAFLRTLTDKRYEHLLSAD